MSLALQERRFPRCRTSVRASRDFVAGVLTEWGITSLIEDAELCVSELATNAVLHGTPPGREFAVRIHTLQECVRLEVRDSGPGCPVVREAGLEATSGRGLFLVSALADVHGVTLHKVGKTVWLEFRKSHAATTCREPGE
ncbi:ATP-binding protein [Streptomyces sp. NBC_00102]|nr:ATP-binding protein [Streptomyces sp. NBC_00102]